MFLYRYLIRRLAPSFLKTCSVLGHASSGQVPGEEGAGHPPLGGGVEAPHHHGGPGGPMCSFVQCHLQTGGKSQRRSK